MKTLKLTILLLIFFNISQAQLVLEKEFEFDNKLKVELYEINTGVYKYVIVKPEESKIELYNLDYSLWREISIPQITDFVIEEVSLITQNLYDSKIPLDFI